MRVLAPAKINLSLEIRGRRADGYHEIDTLMAPLSLADELEIERCGAGIEFSCNESALAGDENLVVRAARLFCAENGVGDGLRIRLEKHIPHGAGLGGGSSDAAATLLELDAIFQTQLGSARLMELAGKLGSDIPFFIARSAARCRGRGEVVEAVELDQKPNLLLLKPAFGVPTPWAYSRWQASRELPGAPYEVQAAPWGRMVNDLERPVFEKYLVLAAMKRWLLDQPEAAGALLSGSGSTMFAVLRDGGAAGLTERAREKFGANLWTHPCRVA